MGDADPTELAATETDTVSERAWGLDEFDYDDSLPTQRFTPCRITTAAVVVSLVLVAGVTAVAWQHWRTTPDVVVAATPTMAVAGPPPPTLEPTSASSVVPAPTPQPETADEKFIVELRGFGVPINDKDLSWTVDLAHAVCTTAHDSPAYKYPPGVHTVVMLTSGVMENNPGWSRQQASRFTNGAVKYYCPDLWGPTQTEIDSLPPDARYLAILRTKLGITAVDDSLVQAAQQVCRWKEQGWWNDKIVDAINSSNPREDEQVIVETATDVYCPQYR